MRRVVFLDRDGTINEDFGYISSPEQVRILPGVIEALSILKDNGWLLVIVSNQSGIGRGYFSIKELLAVQEKIQEELKKNRIILDGVYFCLHAPDEGCACRKPEPGLLLQASMEMNINLEHSWMIGDKISDLIAGQKAGCRSILIGESQNFSGVLENEIFPVVSMPNMWTAAQFILKETC